MMEVERFVKLCKSLYPSRGMESWSSYDVTGVFSTSGSEREFTLEERWYADEETQAGADRNAATAD